jgi:NADPH:quinone reductase-like Zn-dependent oxidoreductase
MNAAVVEDFSISPRYTNFADPVPREKEVLVKVSAAGLHPIVRALANGSHYGSTGVLPFVPGVDGVGRLADGTRVYFGVMRPPFGTFAEYAVTQSWMCVPLPDGLSDVVAAAIANPGMSSMAALKSRAQLVPGENLLILGATGVAGHLAVQIARHLGANRIVAAGRSAKSLEQLAELGADAVISLDQPHDALVAAFRHEIADEGVNVVLDYLWGQPAESVLEAIAQKGLKHDAPRIRFLQVGESAGKTITLPAATLRSSGVELLGSGFGSASIQQIMQAVGEFLRDAAERQFKFNTKAVPLRDVTAFWNAGEPGVRLVFQP